MARWMITSIVAFGFGALVAAHAEPVNPRYLPAAEQQRWGERLRQAQNEIARLEDEVSRLEAKESEAEHDNYPRGEAKAAIEADLREARAGLVVAEKRLPRLVERARRVGVLPEVLRPYR